jgi:hypothetical protein
MRSWSREWRFRAALTPLVGRVFPSSLLRGAGRTLGGPFAYQGVVGAPTVSCFAVPCASWGETGMATVVSAPRDRVLAYTRVLSAVITPFLLVAFVLLSLPGDTRQLFAWTINPTMTSMVLASAYLGGSFFFLRVLPGTASRAS